MQKKKPKKLTNKQTKKTNKQNKIQNQARFKNFFLRVCKLIVI